MHAGGTRLALQWPGVHARCLLDHGTGSRIGPGLEASTGIGTWLGGIDHSMRRNSPADSR